MPVYIEKVEIQSGVTDPTQTQKQTTKYSATQLVFSLKFKLTQSSRYVRVCVASLPDTPNSPQQSINIEGNEGCLLHFLLWDEYKHLLNGNTYCRKTTAFMQLQPSRCL